MTKYKHETLVGVFVFVGLLAIGYLCFELGNISLFKDDHYLLKARFTSAAGLNPGNRVSTAGVPIGTVEAVSLDPKTFTAIVTMRIKDGVQFSDDSIASIKTSGLIGDHFISISPGGSGIVLKPGGTIVDTESSIDLESLISKFAFGSVKKD